MQSKAYLAVEASLAANLFGALDVALRPTLDKADTLMANGDRAGATALINSLTVDGAYETIENAVIYSTNVAMLMGATMVSGSPTTTVVGLGFESESVGPMAEVARSYLRQGLEAVRAKALQLIAQDTGPETVHKADKPVIRGFVSALDSEGNVAIDLAASLHTSRVACYGFTSEANALGITQYQVNEQMDNLTCPVCQHMHGKTFSVKAARDLLKVVTRETDPEALKALQPWPKQTKAALATFKAMSDDDLVAAHWHIPPYHPLCRGLLARVDADVKVGSATIPTGPATYKTTTSDFKDLGLSANKAKVDNWNKNMGVAPLRVLAALTGKTEAEILDESLTGTKAKDALNILLLTATKNATTFAMNSPFYGQGEVAQVLRIQHDKSTMQVNSDDIGSAKVDGVAYMKSLYLLAKDLGIAKILMPVKDKGGAEWLKRGMYPKDLKEWEKLKKHVASSSVAANVVYSAEANAKLTEILTSNDPKAALQLLSVDPAIEEFIASVDWVAGLSVDDLESLTLLLKE